MCARKVQKNMTTGYWVSLWSQKRNENKVKNSAAAKHLNQEQIDL